MYTLIKNYILYAILFKSLTDKLNLMTEQCLSSKNKDDINNTQIAHDKFSNKLSSFNNFDREFIKKEHLIFDKYLSTYKNWDNFFKSFLLLLKNKDNNQSINESINLIKKNNIKNINNNNKYDELFNNLDFNNLSNILSILNFNLIFCIKILRYRILQKKIVYFC